MSHDRDATEWRLLTDAVERRLPVIGICRGLQVINVFFGGRLTQNLAAHGAANHVARPHSLELEPPWPFGPFPEKTTVNSFHSHGVLENDLAHDLLALARSSGDNVIEALRHRDQPILGLQWHPERNPEPSAIDLAVFREWFSGR